MTTSPDLALVGQWERTLVPGAQARSIALLEAFEPGADARALSIGQRDDALLALLGRTFGEQVEAMASCPACGEELELRFSVSEVCGSGAADAAPHLAVSEDGHDVRFRLITGDDLLAAASAPGAAAARALLLERCVASATCAGQPVAAADLPAGVVAAIEARMEAADPRADIRLALSCPGCGHRFSAVFEPGAFVAAELDAYVEGLLQEVDALARRYGWSETEILSLSPTRRQRYLRMEPA